MFAIAYLIIIVWKREMNVNNSLKSEVLVKKGQDVLNYVTSYSYTMRLK